MDSLPIVVENVQICSDAPRVRGAVDAALSLTLPSGAEVRVDFGRPAKGSKSGAEPNAGSERKVTPRGSGLNAIEAHAVLTLPDGSEETRVFETAAARGCASLAKALGAWVSVCVDEWTERGAARGPLALSAAAAPPPGALSIVTSEVDDSRPITTGVEAPYDVDRDGKRIPDLAGPELLTSATMMGGLARSMLVGGTVSAAFNLGASYLMRGSFYGLTAAVTDTYAFGHRVEVCRRFPGRYARSRGLVFDMCGGADVGLLEKSPFVAPGPSIIMHGDVARTVSLDLGAGLSLPIGGAKERDPNPPGLVLAYRGDVGLSVKLP